MIRHRALASTALVVMTAIGAACGDPSELDAERLARDIPAAVIEDHPELVTDVECPEPIDRAVGTTTTCRANVSGTPVDLRVTQLDDDGAVRVDLDRTLLDLDELATVIAGRLTDDLGTPTSVVCEGEVVRVLEVGDTITCDATDPDDRTLSFVATILDESGAYELELE